MSTIYLPTARFRGKDGTLTVSTGQYGRRGGAVWKAQTGRAAFPTSQTMEPVLVDPSNVNSAAQETGAEESSTLTHWKRAALLAGVLGAAVAGLMVGAARFAVEVARFAVGVARFAVERVWDVVLRTHVRQRYRSRAQAHCCEGGPEAVVDSGVAEMPSGASWGEMWNGGTLMLAAALQRAARAAVVAPAVVVVAAIVVAAAVDVAPLLLVFEFDVGPPLAVVFDVAPPLLPVACFRAFEVAAALVAFALSTSSTSET